MAAVQHSAYFSRLPADLVFDFYSMAAGRIAECSPTKWQHAPLLQQFESADVPRPYVLATASWPQMPIV
jgi:hypothetical protein